MDYNYSIIYILSDLVVIYDINKESIHIWFGGHLGEHILTHVKKPAARPLRTDANGVHLVITALDIHVIEARYSNELTCFVTYSFNNITHPQS